MPYAKRRKVTELNKAYAYLSEPSSGEAARTLADKLVAMGFEEDEARDNIEQVQGELGSEDGLFSPNDQPQPAFRHTLAATPEILSALKQTQRDGVTVSETGSGTVEITIAGQVDAHLEQAICTVLPEAERLRIAESFETYRKLVKKQLSPAEQDEKFEVPRLMAELQGELEFADTDVFMEDHDWSLLNHSPHLDEHEFTIRETARSFEIDIDDRRVTYQFAGEKEQLTLNVVVTGWTPEALVLWLDRQVRQADIGQNELLNWLSDLVTHLLNARGLHITALMRCKFILARKIRDKISAIRRQERKSAYQQRLFAPEAKVEISFDDAFSFKAGMYQDQRCYRGRWKPGKHFLGPDHVPAFDGVDDGEEVRCAQAVDSLPGLKYWIRNVARHPASFWLPTATDKFYPDFVSLLNDGRLLVVEYKGAHIADGTDAAEKRTIGELWEHKSAGQGLFIIAEKSVNGRDIHQQLIEKTGTA